MGTCVWYPKTHAENLNMAVHAYNPNTKEAEIGESQGFAGQTR